MHISIIHPSRHRIKQALRTRHNWISRAEMPIEYLFSFDCDDDTIPKSVNGLMLPNKSAIEAINNAVKFVSGDLIIVVSDDFSEPPKGWDRMLLNQLEGCSDFIVKTQDGIQKTLITLPIMDREYYNRFGYIYYPEYQHLFADTEMTVVGHMLGKVINSNILIPHYHYSTGMTQKDAINEKNDATNAQGEALFNKRKEINFGIENHLVTFEEILWH